MSVKLRKRKNSNGTISLRLDIYHEGKRSYELLPNLQLSKGASTADKERNRELINHAEQIRFARSVDLERSNYNLASEIGPKTPVADWMASYIATYKKKDIKNMRGVRGRFVDFLEDSGRNGLQFSKLTAVIIEEFIDYLQATSVGEGAKSYFARFKKMMKHAARTGVIKENPMDKVQRSAKGKAKKKDILTLDEIKTLAATKVESQEVRRAALFSTVTGLAWVDINALTWSGIKLQSLTMEIVRVKMEAENETITIPLNSTAIKLLGDPGKPDQPVFNLGSANGANKTLKAWVRRAGIDKAITWHNLRHSYGTNLIFNDVDVLTTSKLLGHSSTAQTMRYVKAAEEMKQRGTDKLNFDL